MSASDLAFPIGSGDLRDPCGLTKRELVAAMVLQGLCANPGGPYQANGMCGWSLTNCTTDQLSAEAVGLADCLLAALSRATGSQP